MAPTLFSSQAPTRETLTRSALLFAAYFLTAMLGIWIFQAGHTAPALIWPAAGIGLAGLYLGGLELWPAVFLGSFGAIMITGGSPFYALVIAVASAAQSMLGAWMLTALGFSPLFARLRDILALTLVALIPTLVVPAIGTLYLYFTGALATSSISWGSWWTGEIFSFVIVAPVAMRWLVHPRFSRTRGQWIENGAALIAVASVTLLLFFTPYSSFHDIPLVYLILLPLMWVALRLGPRAMTLNLALMSVLALAGAAYKTAGLAPAVSGTTLFLTQIFLIIIAGIFLVLCAVAEERKDAAETLRKHVIDLERALEQIRREDENKTDFIAVLAHELRNPLAPILSSLELMRLRTTAEKPRELINGMRARVRTMGRLLDDLLDISRISHNKLELRRENIDLTRVVERAVESAMPEITSRGHTLSIALPPEELHLEADAVRLEQVVVNLLNNAAKYTEDAGAISLSLKEEGAEAVLRVKDTGVGIVPEMLERIFDPFRQGEPAKRRNSGLGIGLTLSRTLVLMHGGTIEARSRGAGAGSEFIVRLPLTKKIARSPGTQQKAKGSTRRTKHPLRVLVVDDNQAAAAGMAELLSHIGHETLTAFSGTTGLEAAESFSPDAILLDIGLPDMDGHDVAQVLKRRGDKATLIALTGYGQEGDKEKARSVGFAHHLTKPASLADVEALLRTITK